MSLSHVIGPVTPSLLDVTIGGALDEAARSWPSGDAVVCPAHGVRLTWAALHDQAEALLPACWRWEWRRATGSACGR